MFMASRYPFEPSSELNQVNIEVLIELLQLLEDAIRSAAHRWVVAAP